MARTVFILLLFGLFIYVSSPLLLPVAMGGVFAALFFPWMESLEKKKIPHSISAVCIALGSTLVFLLPATFLVFLAAKAGWQKLGGLQGVQQLEDGRTFFENMIRAPGVQNLMKRVVEWFPISEQDLLATAEDFAKAVGIKLATWLGNFFAQLPSLTMGLVIMILSLFFFLLDGHQLSQFVRHHSFFKPDHTDKLVSSFTGMCRSVILASVISGLVQSILYAAACLIVGLSNVPLIWLIVFLTSFIPLIGSMPVTFGIAIFQLLVHSSGIGIGLLIMATVVGVADNLIRPWVLKGSANLHPLLAFIAAFGGIQILGVTGIFLGPILAGLCVATLQVLIAKQYQNPLN